MSKAHCNRLIVTSYANDIDIAGKAIPEKQEKRKPGRTKPFAFVRLTH
ncbi:MAG: hypothetical protein ACOYJF_03355 [Prevotella sp.]|jgi:hypothetical protein